MGESSGGSRIVLIDDDPSRAAKTGAVLLGAGYDVVLERDVARIARLLDDPAPTVVLFDISAPGAARQMSERHAMVADAVADRCPIVLYGDRTETPRTEPPMGPLSSPASSSARRSPMRDGLLDLLAGLLPDPRSSGTPEESERPTNPFTIGSSPRPADVGLPRSDRDQPSFAGPESGASPKAGVGSRQGEWERVRLLLIDESEMTLELMQERLVAEGADVRIAVALGEVDSIVANWCPNMVVANVKRADLAGDALCARLKHAVGSQELRILLCSTLPDAELRLLAMAAGADGFVSKSRGLDSFVREVVEMTMKLSPPNMAIGRARHA